MFVIYTFIVCSQIYGSTRVPIIMYVICKQYMHLLKLLHTDCEPRTNRLNFLCSHEQVMPYFHGTFQTFMKEISAIWHVNGNANKCSWKLACLHWIHFTKIIALPFHLWMKNTINKIFMKPKRVRQVGPKLKICKTCCGFLILVHVSFLCSILSAVFF